MSKLSNKKSERDKPARSQFDTISKFATAAMKGTLAVPAIITDGLMLKAQCKRLANRQIVVGNTAFKFDADGITSIVNQSRVMDDFKILCKMNGVIKLAPLDPSENIVDLEPEIVVKSDVIEPKIRRKFKKT